MIISNLLRENYIANSNSHNVSLTSSVSESFFENALISLTEMNTAFAESKKSLYKGILEANGNQILIQESFSGFLTKAREIIDKFLEAIKRLFVKFVTLLNKFVKSDKYIKKNEKVFSKFNGSHEFEMNIFTYTFNDAVPVIDANALVGWDNAAGYTPYNTVTDKESSSALEKVELRYNALKGIAGSDSYDAHRGAVIGKETSIAASDYAKELYQVFRNGESTKTKSTINYATVEEALNHFTNYEKTLKAITDKKNEIEKVYKGIKDTVKKWSDNMDSKSSLNLIFGDSAPSMENELPENKKKIDNYAQMFATLMISRIEQMSTIHATAFSAKLDATKECFTQDKKILYGALTKIQKDKSISLKESSDEDDDYEDDYEGDDYEDLDVPAEYLDTLEDAEDEDDYYYEEEDE